MNLSDSRTAGQPAESVGAQPLARLSAAEAVF
ncbi:MAG TPA: GntR family transcriptional regulator, partial [Arthrobacter bacterium]|nr:GntR family transcriptional regulator [Arthrobacter sp.]